MDVRFFRHALLQPPYDNYDNLTYEQLDGLAKQEIQPQIDTEWAKKKLQEQNLSVIPQVLFVAPSLRAKETGLLLKGSGTKTIILEELNEIHFELAGLVSRDEFQKRGLRLLRNRFYLEILNRNPKMDSFASIYTKLMLIDNVLKQQENEIVWFVTHGFLLRYIDLYFNYSKDQQALTIAAVEKPKRYDYLGMVEVSIS